MRPASAVMMLLAGCGGSQGGLTIRSTSVPLSAVAKPVPARVAEARGHLALGNVALALEGFRRAERDDPSSTDAITGIATCYDQMGRFELSRRFYEKALALSPANPALLAAFAASLDLQGQSAEAANVRREIAVRESSAREEQDIALTPSLSPAPTVGSVTILLPEPAPAAARRSAETATVLPPRIARSEPGRRGPRLERLSLGEVALVTTEPRRWRTEVVSRTASSTTLRFVPLPRNSQSKVRLLNSARHEGLAARTRLALHGKGWKRVTIGDSVRIRGKSLVLYSTGSERAARQLAAQFGFGMAREPRPGPITVLLGRDAIGHTGSRT